MENREKKVHPFSKKAFWQLSSWSDQHVASVVGKRFCLVIRRHCMSLRLFLVVVVGFQTT